MELLPCRNPFQGGMGISTIELGPVLDGTLDPQSQSLSGWDGDFHGYEAKAARIWDGQSQSLSGWDGDFHSKYRLTPHRILFVAIPFRVGWGFPLKVKEWLEKFNLRSQSLSGWDGDFHH